MTPERQITIKGKKIQEFYWAGKFVVYIDNQAFGGTYDNALTFARHQQDHSK